VFFFFFKCTNYLFGDHKESGGKSGMKCVNFFLIYIVLK